jgi:hypothetical protein
MDIASRGATGKSQFGEWMYHVCSARRAEDIDRDPEKYLLRK